MKSIILLNAIVWATLIIIASVLYKGTENYIYLLGSILVGFSLQNGLLFNFIKRIDKSNCK